MLDITDWQNKKYTTRDGRPVRILCVNVKGARGEIAVGLIQNNDGTEDISSWYEGGFYYKSGIISGHDLFDAKTKKEGWIQVRPLLNKDNTMSSIAFTTNVYETKEDAILNGWGPHCQCVKIEWEE